MGHITRPLLALLTGAAVLIAGGTAEARPLTQAELADFGTWLSCAEACGPLPSSPTYDQFVAQQRCLVDGVLPTGVQGTPCGEAPFVWEKNGIHPVDRLDHELALLEYQHASQTPALQVSDPLICYGDVDETIVVPSTLCAGAVCQQVDPTVCSAAACAAPSGPLQLNCAGTTCWWPNQSRPALCPDSVCTANPSFSAADCADTDGDGLAGWLEAKLGTSPTVKDEACSAATPCSFDERCVGVADQPHGTCQVRPCKASGTCTAFHLEVVAQDDTQAIIHVFYDYTPIPARVLDLHVDYDTDKLTLQDARLLEPVSIWGKELATSHLSDQTLRLSIYDSGTSHPIPFGPVVELVFGRSGADAATVAFSTDDDLQLKAVAPLLGSLTGVQSELATDDSLWGAAVTLPKRDAVPTKLRLWYGFEGQDSPMNYSAVPTGEALCEMWPECANEPIELEALRMKARLKALQDGDLLASDSLEFGVTGTAVYLDGNQDHLRLPILVEEPLYASSQSLSFGTWVYSEGNGANEDPTAPQLIYSHNGFDERTRFGLELRPVSAGTAMDVVFFVGDKLSSTQQFGAGVATTRKVAAAVPLREWHHVGFSVDAATREVVLYWDGQPIPPAAGGSGPSFTIPANGVAPVIACPGFPNSVDITLHKEGQDKGTLTGSTAPTHVYMGVRRNNLYRIVRIDDSGLQTKTIIGDGERSYRDPDYSPSLDRILYASNATGSMEIWIANGDGSNRRQLTDGFGNAELDIVARRPRWSPDGSGFVFESNAFDVPQMDNIFRRVWNLYYVPFDPTSDKVVAPVAGGGTTEQLVYDDLLQSDFVDSFRITSEDLDKHYTNAFWLEGKPTLASSDQVGDLVATRADELYDGKRLVRIVLKDILQQSTINEISGFGAPGDEQAVVAARRLTVPVQAGTAVEQRDMLLFEQSPPVSTVGIVPWSLFTVDLAKTDPPVAFTRGPGAGKPDLFEQLEQAVFAPRLIQPGSALRLLLGGVSHAQPVLLRTKSHLTAAGASKVTVEPTRVRGLSWVDAERIHPCHFVGGYRHPQTKLNQFGLRGGLDDTKVWAGLRDPDAFRSEFERGREILERDDIDGTLPSLLPQCEAGQHTDCPPYHLCIDANAGTGNPPKYTCQMTACDPAAATPCPDGGRCSLRPVSIEQSSTSTGATSYAWVCAADCAVDQECLTAECLNGSCLYCSDDNTCIECKDYSTQVGALTVTGIVGCPDERSFDCSVGACVTECYAFEDGTSIYLCDPDLEYCDKGKCVPHDWSWWDFAPASFSGLGEMRRTLAPSADFNGYTQVIDQAIPVEITAYGVADYEEPPELAVEIKGGTIYGASKWVRAGRVLVHARTLAEAQANPLVLSVPHRFTELRLRMLNAPYANLTGGATGLGPVGGSDVKARDRHFCHEDYQAALAAAGTAPVGPSPCLTRAPGSRKALGYRATIPTHEALAACEAAGHGGCPTIDDSEHLLLYGGQPAVRLEGVKVKGSAAPLSSNKICKYVTTKGGTPADGPTTGGTPNTPAFGDYGQEKSNLQQAACAAAGTCGATALVDTVGTSLLPHLNCNYIGTSPGQLAAAHYTVALAPLQPVVFKGGVEETPGLSCSVEVTQALTEPCYQWLGGDVSADPGNDLVKSGSYVPHGALQFGLVRGFGHDAGFDVVELPKYTLSATVAGLAGDKVVVSNGKETVTLTPGSATATFTTLLKKNRIARMKITTQPAIADHRCFFEVDGELSTHRDVTMTAAADVAVTCRSVYALGGTASGLTEAVTLDLALGGQPAAEVEVLADGTFTFPEKLPVGATFAVTVDESSTAQECTLSASAAGTMPAAAVADIALTCKAPTPYGLSVTVAGLQAAPTTALVLTERKGFDAATTAAQEAGTKVSVTADGTVTFPAKVPYKSAFDIGVTIQPDNPPYSCVVGDGAVGVMPKSDHVATTVTCEKLPSVHIGGSVAGLSGTGLKLTLDGDAATAVTLSGNATGDPIEFQWTHKEVAVGASYTVAVTAQPTNPPQVCSLVDTVDGGLVASATNEATEGTSVLTVICKPAPPAPAYALSGTISGLDAAQGQGVVLSLNSGVGEEFTANGPFTFENPMTAGTAINVVVKEHPLQPVQACQVLNVPEKMPDGPLTNIHIACVKAYRVKVVLDDHKAYEGAEIRAQLVSGGSSAAVLGREPGGTSLLNGSATFVIRMDLDLPLGQLPPAILIPDIGAKQVFSLYVYVNKDGSQDTLTKDPLFNDGDVGFSTAVCAGAACGSGDGFKAGGDREIVVDVPAALTTLVQARVEPKTPAGNERVVCYWGPVGSKPALIPPVNPAVAPVLAETAQCYVGGAWTACESTSLLAALVDEPLLPGTYDVACWRDKDGDGEFSNGDHIGSMSNAKPDPKHNTGSAALLDEADKMIFGAP